MLLPKSISSLIQEKKKIKHIIEPCLLTHRNTFCYILKVSPQINSHYLSTRVCFPKPSSKSQYNFSFCSSRLAWAKNIQDPRIAVGSHSPLEKKIKVRKYVYVNIGASHKIIKMCHQVKRAQEFPRCLSLLETHFPNEKYCNFRPFTFSMNRCHYSLSHLSLLVKQ